MASIKRALEDRAEVIRLSDRKRNVVKVDWSTIEEIREAVKKYSKAFGFASLKNNPLNIRGAYDRCQVYAGKTTVNLTFERVYVHFTVMPKLERFIRGEFDVQTYTSGNNLKVYLIGRRKQ